MSDNGRHNVGTVIIGMSGMGKSWFEGYLIEQSPKQRIILDPKGEHGGLCEKHLIIDRATIAAIAKLREGWVDFFRRVLATKKSVRIQVIGLDIEEQLTMVDGLARAIHERGHLLFVGCEYHRFAPNGRVPKWVQILHTDARSQQVDYIVSTQRLALLDTTIISQANRRITFKLEDINDLKRVESLFRATEGHSRSRDAIANLRPRTCLYIDADSSEQELIMTEGLVRRVQHHG